MHLYYDRIPCNIGYAAVGEHGKVLDLLSSYERACYSTYNVYQQIYEEYMPLDREV
jgi:hypothetical protein